LSGLNIHTFIWLSVLCFLLSFRFGREGISTLKTVTILGDPGATSRDDAIFLANQRTDFDYFWNSFGKKKCPGALQSLKQTFAPKMSLARKYRIVPTSSPWVSEDGQWLTHIQTPRSWSKVFCCALYFEVTSWSHFLIFSNVVSAGSGVWYISHMIVLAFSRGCLHSLSSLYWCTGTMRR